MEKDLQIAPQQPSALSQPTPVTLTQTGDGNTQIGYVGQFQQVVLLQGNRRSRVPIIGQNVVFNYDCFNLFVMGGETYDADYFMVPKNKALTESTPEDIWELCASMSQDAIAAIKSFPAVFCSTNRHHEKTDPDHMAYYGYVTDVQIQENGIRIFFQLLVQFPQQVLIDLSKELCIDGAKSYTEMCHTHWGIKRSNLVEALERAGVRLLK